MLLKSESLMDVAMADFYYSGYNAAATTNVGWLNWSPAIGWLSISPQEDLHDEKESMMAWQYSDDYALAGSSPETLDHWSSSNVSEMTLSSAAETPAEEPRKLSNVSEIDKGIRLIHLLTAAAEALAGDQKSHELSKVILARLKELLPSPASGSSLERLAGHFAKALNNLLVDGEAENNYSGIEATAVTAASQLLQDMSPYVNFGHFTANQAIVEAVGGERRVHIVDFDIMEGAQWAPLLQAFMSMKDGPPPSHVKITAVTEGRKSASATVQETGRMLAAFAASIGLPFSFAQCRLDRDGCFRAAALKVLRGEAIVFNIALHAPHHHHHSPVSIRSFLAGAAEFGARLVTVVEEEGRATAGGGKGGFLVGFMEELQRYSTLWDALEAGFPKQSQAREMVENLVFGPRIGGAVEGAFRRREEEVPESWSEWMAAAEFQKVELSFFNQWQAKLLLGLFNEGYRVEEEDTNKLVLGWKTRRLVSASVWSAKPPRADAED